MTATLKLKIDSDKLKRILGKKINLVQDNIASVLKNEAIPDLINRIMIGFDGLVSRAEMLPEDPTNPAHWRQEFLNKLKQDMNQTFSVSGNRIMVKLGEKKFLGYDPSGPSNDNTPLRWMVFYIEGLAGDWAFISPETYETFRKKGRYDHEKWGRFGEGFMISREDFFKEGWNEIISFDQVRHPFSGYSPVDIFTEALNEWKLKPFVDKAIKAAVEGRKL